MISKEYATYFSIAKELEVHESTIYRIVKKTEDILIQSGKFALPGKKVLRNELRQFEVILADVAEQPIERPKKKRVKNGKKLRIGITNKRNTTQVKRKCTPRNIQW